MKIELTDDTKEKIRETPEFLYGLTFCICIGSGVTLGINYVFNSRIMDWLVPVFLFSFAIVILPDLISFIISVPDRIKEWKEEHYKNGVLKI